MKITVKRLPKEDWAILSKDAHLGGFNENWEEGFERIDYALITVDPDNQIIQYITIRELDRDTAYLQYGACHPRWRGSVIAWRSFEAVLEYLKGNYSKVTFLVENTNSPMLRFALKAGFLVSGLRVYRDSVLLEHGLEFKKSA